MIYRALNSVSNIRWYRRGRNELRPYNKDAVDVIRHDDEFIYY